MFKKFPVSKGMAAYAVLWPSSDLCRQLAVKGNQKDEKYEMCNALKVLLHLHHGQHHLYKLITNCSSVFN